MFAVPMKPKRRQANALLQGIEDFWDGKYSDSSRSVMEFADLPKRFTVYEPMLLLPPTFEHHSTSWKSIYTTLTTAQKEQLFTSITKAFCKTGHRVTHVAINAPIAPTIHDEDGETVEENVIRSPAHLQPLYGDFGPARLLSPDSIEPTENDFAAALWVETSQLTGIKQVWAPRWSMFSRGNVREKARIVGVSQQNPAPFLGLGERELGEPIANVDVVDMYVGIGYFALAYLKRGVRRVFGWDINAWSIEALRRGCVRNGFGCEVIKLTDFDGVIQLEEVAEGVGQILTQRPEIRCVAFLGDNKKAGDIITAIVAQNRHNPLLNVRHCNLGLLPSSEQSWAESIKALDNQGGWLHVHENADIKQVEQKRVLVEGALLLLANQNRGRDWAVVCNHVEMVKTYAPGVGHFVFDFHISPSNSTAAS